MVGYRARLFVLSFMILLLTGFGYADQNIKYAYVCSQGLMKVTLNVDKTIHITKKNVKGVFTVGAGETPAQPGSVDYQGKLIGTSSRRQHPASLNVPQAFLAGKSLVTIRLDRTEYTDCKRD